VSHAASTGEDGDDLEVTGNKASDDAQDGEDDGVGPVVEQTEDVDNGLNYLIEE
jgi:hypothetical protein